MSKKRIQYFKLKVWKQLTLITINIILRAFYFFVFMYKML